MIDKKIVYLYTLLDCQGNENTVVVDDPADNIRIGGFDKDNNYQQYDSYEAWYVYGWAEKHGFYVYMEEREIEIQSKRKT